MKNDEPPSRKARQIRLKMLATKLAILFQGKTRGANSMRSSPPAELSLFSSSGVRKYLTKAERERFLHATETLDPMRRLFCAVLLWSGGRVSEVLAITPQAVDIDSCDIALLTLKRRNKFVVRQIPLPPSVMHALDEHLHLRSRQEDPRQTHRRLWPWSRTTAWRIIKKVMRDAGVTTLAASPKGLRHSFGVTAFQAKVPPHLVQRWLGHASLRTTSIYGNVLGEEEREFAARMW
ncbi:tyrosine-type recombinase/integrase [Bradyrhizobium cytisi]|uniref:tyrosine-type recombinase/integrase n=1 Tax=Bradyrhizobium cytisi TaxID=515489 RepID=UPI001652FA9A|nr:tyrosine-type recombinase/integrase [Bradyrhizobium cytisi]